ncbi:MAG: YggT family protein [Brevinematia bacterium]
MFEVFSIFQILFLILANIIRLYEFILFIRVIFSWLVMINPSLISSIFFKIVYVITEPPLSFIKDHLPSRLGFFDLSVLWLFIILELFYMGIMKTISLL